jgi:hypothetical protein
MLAEFAQRRAEREAFVKRREQCWASGQAFNEVFDVDDDAWDREDAEMCLLENRMRAPPPALVAALLGQSSNRQNGSAVGDRRTQKYSHRESAYDK